MREQAFAHFQGKEHQASTTSICNTKGKPPIANYIMESTHSFKSSGGQNDHVCCICETGIFCSTQATKNFLSNGKLRCHWNFVKAGRQSLAAVVPNGNSLMLDSPQFLWESGIPILNKELQIEDLLWSCGLGDDLVTASTCDAGGPTAGQMQGFWERWNLTALIFIFERHSPISRNHCVQEWWWWVNLKGFI